MRKVITSFLLASLICGSILIYYIQNQTISLVISQKIDSIVKNIYPQNTTSTPLPPISSLEFSQIIDDYRVGVNLPILPSGQKTCLMAQMALGNNRLDTTIISQKCPECQSVQIARFSQPLDADLFIKDLDTNATISAYILSTNLTHMCVATSSSEAVLTLVTAKPITPKIVIPTPTEFSEDQLWEALSIYRHSQGVNQLTRDESLCVYARKRVQDQLTLMASKISPKDYPVEDKYPLDAHDGFKKDADTGLVFDITHKTEVAENLAYWPNASNAIHIIEWGWDSSTEGHRETQLSEHYNSACLSGAKGFYVAIFGK